MPGGHPPHAPEAQVFTMPEQSNQPVLGQRLQATARPTPVRAHFPARQGRLTEIAGLCGEHLPQDVPYLRRSTLREAEARSTRRHRRGPALEHPAEDRDGGSAV